MSANPERRAGLRLVLLAVLVLAAGCDDQSSQGSSRTATSAAANRVAANRVAANRAASVPGSSRGESDKLLDGPRVTDTAALKDTGWVAVPLALADPAGVPPGPLVMQSHALS
ncbi:MAG: hypothetical protein ACI9EF_003543, partial [Pseudohongiellaceae bacterium]